MSRIQHPAHHRQLLPCRGSAVSGGCRTHRAPHTRHISLSARNKEIRPHSHGANRVSALKEGNNLCDPTPVTQGTRPCEQAHSYLAVADNNREHGGTNSGKIGGFMKDTGGGKCGEPWKETTEGATAPTSLGCDASATAHGLASLTPQSAGNRLYIWLSGPCIKSVSKNIHARTQRARALHTHSNAAHTLQSRAPGEQPRTHTTTCNGGCRHRGTSNP